ncbi:hypothetical protein KCP73_13165 [Salmonella enterica subsp. enterica]|nr:hypothetical protein KCP73_13165 [Salmonella enterica subsp. enterica]
MSTITLIDFCPGEFGPAKRWPHYHYAELAKQLINEGCQVVLLARQRPKPESKDHGGGAE